MQVDDQELKEFKEIEVIDLDKTITLGELIALCAQYDVEQSSYPENEYEGFSVLNHVLRVKADRPETYRIFDKYDAALDAELEKDQITKIFRDAIKTSKPAL